MEEKKTIHSGQQHDGYFDPFAVERPGKSSVFQNPDTRDEREEKDETESKGEEISEKREIPETKESQRYRQRTQRFVTFSIRRDIIAMLRTVQAVLQLTGRPKTSMNDLLYRFTQKCVKAEFPEAWHLIGSRERKDEDNAEP